MKAPTFEKMDKTVNDFLFSALDYNDIDKIPSICYFASKCTYNQIQNSSCSFHFGENRECIGLKNIICKVKNYYIVYDEKSLIFVRVDCKNECFYLKHFIDLHDYANKSELLGTLIYKINNL